MIKRPVTFKKTPKVMSLVTSEVLVKRLAVKKLLAVEISLKVVQLKHLLMVQKVA